MESKTNDMLDLYPVYDERLESLQSKLSYGLYKGADNLMFREYQSTNLSNNLISFNIKSPSLQSCVDACFFIKTQFSYKILATGDGTTGAADLDLGLGLSVANEKTNTCVLSALPVFNMAQTTAVSVNNAPLSIDNSFLNDVIMRTIPQKVLNEYQDFTPAMKSYRTNSVVAGNNSIFNDGTFTSHCCKPNGSFKYDSVVYTAKTGTSAGYLTITASTIEPVIHPYLSLKYGEKSLSNISTLDLNINLTGSLNQSVMIGTKAGSTSQVASVSLVNISSSSLYLAWLKAPLFMPLKTKTISPFVQPVLVNNKSKDAVSTNQLSNIPISSDTITFNSIPSAIGVYFRPKRAYFVNKPIQNCVLNSLSVSFGRSGILSDVQGVQLQNMCKKNGLEDQTSELWNGYSAAGFAVGGTGGALTQTTYPNIGPMILFNPVLDYGVNSSICNSSEGSYDFQINTNWNDNTGVQNIGGGNPEYEFGIVAYYDGVLISSLGSSFIWNGMITNEMSLSQDIQPSVPMSEHKLYGGGIFDRITSFGKKLANSSVGKALLPMAKDLVKEQVCGNGTMYR